MRILSAPLVVILTAIALASATVGGYHLLQTVHVPGDEGWDYCIVDSAARRVYFSHSSHVVVMDADSGRLVGTIPKTDGVHGIALAPELDRGFTSNGRSNSVTIFDLKTLATLKEVKVNANTPDGIMYDPATKRVFTSNRGSDSSSVIDAVEDKLVGTINLGGRPEFLTADGKGHVFIDLVDKNTVVQIDSRKMVVSQRWPTSPCQKPSTSAIDRKNMRLFVGCGNKLMAIFNATNGHLITTVPIGKGRDAARFDPEEHLVFSSNGEGTVTVIRQKSPDDYSVLQTVKTTPGARTMALDLKTHKIFLPVAERKPAPPGRRRGEIVHGSFRILIFGM